MEMTELHMKMADIATIWSSAMRAAFVAGFVTLLAVGSIRFLFRHRISNAMSHAMFLLVPLKTVAAVLFVLCPLVVTFEMPEVWVSSPENTIAEWIEPSENALSGIRTTQQGALAEPGNAVSEAGQMIAAELKPRNSGRIANTGRITGEIDRPAITKLAPFGKSQLTAQHAIFAWATFCTILAGICMVRNGIVQYRTRHTSAPVSGDDISLVIELANAMRLSQVPIVVMTSAIANPAVIGLIRPRLLVPEGFFRNFDEAICRWAIAHELAHVRRADLWTLAFERVVGIVFFFCPALWISQRLTRHFRELACDDAAQDSSGLSGGECAESFLQLIVWSSGRSAGIWPITPALSLTHRYPAIRRRIMNMTDTNESRRTPRLSRKAIATCTIAAIFAALPVVPKIVAQTPQAPKEIKESKPASDAANSKSGISIGGIVVDDKDKPVSNAEIKVISFENYRTGGSPSLIASTRSDASGRFRIAEVPPAEKLPMVQFTHPEFSYDSIAFRPTDPHYHSLIEGNATLKLYKGANVRGKVVDPDGKPVAGATVQSVRPFFFVESRDATTNAEGEFECKYAAPQGLDAFVIRKPGLGLTVSKSSNAGTFPDPLTVRLEKARAFRATVTDTQGKPLSGVAVEVRLKSASNFEVERTVTGEDGRVTFENLPAGQDLALHSYKSGFIYDLRTIVASDTEDKRIAMRKSVALTGTVTDRISSSPIARFDVRLEGFDESDSTWKRSSYDDFYGGRYRFDLVSVLPKTFRFVFEAAGYRPFVTDSYKLETSPAKLDVKLDPIPFEEWPHYRGKILGIDDKPIASARIGLFTENDFPNFENGVITRSERDRPIPQTDSSGNFDFRSPELVKEILVLHESGVLRQNLNPETNQAGLEWKLQPYGRIAGFIRRNGKPDVDSKIVLIYPSGVKNHTGPRMLIEQSADGSFVVDKIIPGRVSIDFRLADVSINDHTNIWMPYLIEPGKTTTIERDLKLNDVPRRTVKGKFRFADRPVPMNMSQSRISLWAPEGNPLRMTPEVPYVNSPERLKYRETPEGKALHQALEEFVLLEKTISPEGAFEIKGMPSGTFELHIWPGNLNVSYGQAKKVFRVDPAADGDANAPIDLGEIDVINTNARKPGPGTPKPGETIKPDSKSKPGS